MKRNSLLENTIKPFYNKKRVFVTGGAGFIGSRLLNFLLQCGAYVTVGDNLSSGSIENVKRVWKSNKISFKKSSLGYITDGFGNFVHMDFRNYDDCTRCIVDQDVVFHLAATIGGRGFIEEHPADCCENFAINQNVIQACSKASVDRVIYASSACVYPITLQNKYGSDYKLKENDVNMDSWMNADRSYGWSKLMGELSLQSYHKQYKLKGCSVRYVTAYGPWENDTHAIIMLCKKALRRDDPYIVWGSGNQDRDFTFVDDIVEATLLSGIHLTDGSAINIGTGKRFTIKEVIDTIFDIVGWEPNRVIFDRSKPEGVKSRALNISKANRKLSWSPSYNLKQGLLKTIEWISKID